MPELILASTSSYRRALLERLGIAFRCLAPLVDEEAFKDTDATPRSLAAGLARRKAESVSAAAPRAVVVGGDQVVAFEGRIFGKPGETGRAVEQLLALSGRPHELITAVAVVHPGGVFDYTDVTTLWMRALDRAAVERYVAADSPLDCAGSYKLEQRGIALFDRIESADHTAVTGLPLIALTTILRNLGFAIP